MIKLLAILFVAGLLSSGGAVAADAMGKDVMTRESAMDGTKMENPAMDRDTGDESAKGGAATTMGAAMMRKEGEGMTAPAGAMMEKGGM